MEQKKCKNKGCSNPIAIKQVELCAKCYKQGQRKGTLEISRPIVDKSIKCNVPGCERSQQTKDGLCLMHYKRTVRNGSTELPVINLKRDKKCIYCDKPTGASGSRGMCSRHYQMYKLHGNPLYVEIKRSLPGSRGYLRNTDGVCVHVRIMEAHIGRFLAKGEVVHHIDTIKTNNEINNLYLCKSKSEHAAIHAKLRAFSRDGIDISCLSFANGEYIYIG